MWVLHNKEQNNLESNIAKLGWTYKEWYRGANIQCDQINFFDEVGLNPVKYNVLFRTCIYCQLLKIQKIKKKRPEMAHEDQIYHGLMSHYIDLRVL